MIRIICPAGGMAYAADLKSAFYGFESRAGYHLYASFILSISIVFDRLSDPSDLSNGSDKSAFSAF